MAVEKLDIGTTIADGMDYQIKQAEGIVDPILRLGVAPGVTLSIPKLREWMDSVEVPLENVAGEAYSVPLRTLLANLLLDNSEIA